MEAVFEDMTLKKDLFKKLDAICKVIEKITFIIVELSLNIFSVIL